MTIAAASVDPVGPIAYMARTQAYYQALGYGEPYQWAQFGEVPFTAVSAPLRSRRVALVTTAAPFKPGAGDQGPGAPYNAAAKFYTVYSGSTDTMPDLRISHIAIDRVHTTASDIGSYFPLAALWRARDRGRIGAVAARFHGLPTNRSQRTTLDVDAPEIVRRVSEDGAAAALLVANCPVCHQSTAIAARALEAAGVATVVMGAAKDIVEHVGVPRFLFSDFPLGNAAGIPHDAASQDLTLDRALRLLETATGPRTTAVNPLVWPGPAAWRLDYCNIDRLGADEIACRRASFDEAKRTAAALRSSG
jgi:hypothetical protein